MGFGRRWTMTSLFLLSFPALEILIGVLDNGWFWFTGGGGGELCPRASKSRGIFFKKYHLHCKYRRHQWGPGVTWTIKRWRDVRNEKREGDNWGTRMRLSGMNRMLVSRDGREGDTENNVSKSLKTWVCRQLLYEPSIWRQEDTEMRETWWPSKG